MLAPHAGNAGSNPALVTDYGQVVQLVDTRRSERRALTGLGVQLSPWSLQAGQVSDWLS
jgi:hypothetical protein